MKQREDELELQKILDAYRATTMCRREARNQDPSSENLLSDETRAAEQIDLPIATDRVGRLIRGVEMCEFKIDDLLFRLHQQDRKAENMLNSFTSLQEKLPDISEFQQNAEVLVEKLQVMKDLELWATQVGAFHDCNS